ncbi:hypothetical protein GXM_01216 [Nostoc sphaeroides CCNUC1]|uniref:Uncharacterized protein n=1 Tax=Nostoc sphaeroides CCNUC1 TaxID=2653204 RepID=A0A5P8VTL7_9NOSO|nr:hypothetical protein GXM_01216 [Nostoc sphaeroides CCNUC1]
MLGQLETKGDNWQKVDRGLTLLRNSERKYGGEKFKLRLA